MEKAKLSQLKKALPAFPHISSTEPMRHQDWIIGGRPHNWLPLAAIGVFSVFSDENYGLLALFEENTLLKVGKDFLFTPKIAFNSEDNSFYLRA